MTTSPTEQQQVEGRQPHQPLTLTFTLPKLPISHNRIYGQEYNRELGYTTRGLSAEHRLWRTEMGEYVPSRSKFRIATDSEVSINCTFHYPYRHGNGNLRRFDSANLLKGVLDLVSKRLGFDDFRVRCGGWSSVDSTNPKVIVTLVEVIT